MIFGCVILCHALQHSYKIVVRIEVVQTSDDQQTLYDAGLLGAEFGPDKHQLGQNHQDQ